MRNFVLALSLFLMILLGWFYYQFSGDCCGQVSTIIESDASTGNIEDQENSTSAISSDSGANAENGGMSDYLMFNWSETEPVVRDDWEARKDRIISNLGEDELLEITGLFRPGETNNSSFDNLGEARANRIKGMLAPPLEDARISIKSKEVESSGSQEDLFAGVNFRTYVKKQNLDTSIPDRTIIRFPFNSDNRINDPVVEDYLKKVASRVKDSAEKIQITGHTDNIGSIESNIVLGQRRADIVKRYLIDLGVPGNQIITQSKGESSPIATNSTSSGRSENRRAELQIIN